MKQPPDLCRLSCLGGAPVLRAASESDRSEISALSLSRWCCEQAFLGFPADHPC